MADHESIVAVAEWLAREFETPVTVAEPPVPIGDGLDNQIFFVRFAGDGLPAKFTAPLVCRIAETAARLPRLERERTVHAFCMAAGYPVPEIIAVIPPGGSIERPMQLLERAPGKTMLAVMTSMPWRFGSSAKLLGALHARLHALPIEHWPFPEELAMRGRALADKRLGLVHAVVQKAGPDVPALRVALERVEERASALETDDSRVCHGDFHPLNVVVSQNDASVIDWTDAALGDRHCDVARLLTLLDELPIANPNRAGAALLRLVGPRLKRRYVDGYRAVGGTLDDGRLEAWTPVHLVHDWARRGVVSGPARVNPAVVEWTKRRLDEMLPGPSASP